MLLPTWVHKFTSRLIQYSIKTNRTCFNSSGRCKINKTINKIRKVSQIQRPNKTTMFRTLYHSLWIINWTNRNTRHRMSKRHFKRPLWCNKTPSQMTMKLIWKIHQTSRIRLILQMIRLMKAQSQLKLAVSNRFPRKSFCTLYWRENMEINPEISKNIFRIRLTMLSFFFSW